MTAQAWTGSGKDVPFMSVLEDGLVILGDRLSEYKLKPVLVIGWRKGELTVFVDLSTPTFVGKVVDIQTAFERCSERQRTCREANSARAVPLGEKRRPVRCANPMCKHAWSKHERSTLQMPCTSKHCGCRSFVQPENVPL